MLCLSVLALAPAMGVFGWRVVRRTDPSPALVWTPALLAFAGDAAASPHDGWWLQGAFLVGLVAPFVTAGWALAALLRPPGRLEVSWLSVGAAALLAAASAATGHPGGLGLIPVMLLWAVSCDDAAWRRTRVLVVTTAALGTLAVGASDLLAMRMNQPSEGGLACALVGLTAWMLTVATQREARLAAVAGTGLALVLLSGVQPERFRYRDQVLDAVAMDDLPVLPAAVESNDPGPVKPASWSSRDRCDAFFADCLVVDGEVREVGTGAPGTCPADSTRLYVVAADTPLSDLVALPHALRKGTVCVVGRVGDDELGAASVMVIDAARARLLGRDGDTLLIDGGPAVPLGPDAGKQVKDALEGLMTRAVRFDPRSSWTVQQVVDVAAMLQEARVYSGLRPIPAPGCVTLEGTPAWCDADGYAQAWMTDRRSFSSFLEDVPLEQHGAFEVWRFGDRLAVADGERLLVIRPDALDAETRRAAFAHIDAPDLSAR